MILSPQGQSGLEAKSFASASALASNIWPRPDLDLVVLFLFLFFISCRGYRSGSVPTTFHHAASAVRDLGIYIDSDVSMRSHVAKTVSACYSVLRQLRTIRRSVSRSVLQSLVSSLVLSRLDYGNSTLAGVHHISCHGCSQ